MNKLVFQNTPIVNFASNKFIDVPIVLQFDEIPLIEVVRNDTAGFTTKIPIYHSDGTYLAKAVGSRLHLTSDGEKAGLKLIHPDNMTVCKLDGKTLFEMRREGAASLSTTAELFTPEGFFVKYLEDAHSLIDPDGNSLSAGGITMTNSTITGSQIGVWVKSDGSVAIGCNPQPKQSFRASAKQGRNEPCLCGSGLKYKRCCGEVI